MDYNTDLKEKRRGEIIHAAMRVFSQYGYERAKMENIAAEAGIGKGTIYEYFPSKKRLFEDMIYFNLDKYKKSLEKIALKKVSFNQKFHDLCQYNADFLRQHLDILQFISKQGIELSNSMKKRLLEERNEIFNIFVQMLREAIFRGEIRQNIDEEAAVVCIIGIITQIASEKVFIDKGDSSNYGSEPFLDILMNGLANKNDH